ncbi:MAG: hypothetical protein N2C14_00600, partial [Planctomycetales bacterium]
MNAAVGHVGASAFGLTYPVIRRAHLKHHASHGGEEDLESFIYRSRWLLIPRLLLVNWNCYAAAPRLGRVELFRAAMMTSGIVLLAIWRPY